MIELAHYAPLTPLAWWIARHRRRGTYLLVACGLAVSWVADSVTLLLGGSWALGPWLPVVQLGLIAGAFGGWGLTVLLPYVAVLQLLVTGAAPGALTLVVGSVGVLYLSSHHPLRWSMIWYCGVGTVFALLMLANIDDPARFEAWWWPYQIARLTAFGLFVRATWKA